MRKVRLYLRCFVSAAHYLPGYNGPCRRLHGHTWKIEVWISGPVNPETGMVVDFRRVKQIIQEHDHQVLNLTLDSEPTAENFAAALCGKLDRLQDCEVTRLRVWESADCCVEIS